jgi:serine/threonine protein kinase
MSLADEIFLFNIGDRIKNQYEVRQRYRGGMGVVYLCYDHESESAVAIKTFHRHLLRDDRARRRFVEEALIWIQLGVHPNIVTAHTVEVVAGQPYVLVECVLAPDGGDPSLRRILRGVPLEAEFGVDLGCQVCDAMIHAQNMARGLVHCDIKPENLLIDAIGVVKVTDFGLAKEYQSNFADETDVSVRKDVLGRREGTPAYMSPEQNLGGAIGPTSDIYSLGVVLYEILTGRRPFPMASFRGSAQRHLYSQPEPPNAINPRLRKDFSTVVLRCLEKTPADRPRSFAELKEQLLECSTKPAKSL